MVNVWQKRGSCLTFVFLFILGNSSRQFLCWLNQRCGTQDVFALIWLKRQHGSDSRGARGALQEGGQIEILIRRFSFLSAPTIGLGCTNPLSLRLLFFSLPLQFVCLFFGLADWVQSIIIQCRTLTHHFVPFSFLFFVFYCLFWAARNVSFPVIPGGNLKCVFYRQIVLFKCFLPRWLYLNGPVISLLMLTEG